jgi:hypothetical protein
MPICLLLTRAALITAALPIHSSNFNSAGNRSNQRGMSGSLDPYPHADLSSFKSAIEMFCLSIAVVQSPFTSLACSIDIRYLLNA